MDNLDIYLYIIILVIYAVTRIFKSASKKPPVRTVPGKQQPPSGTQPGDQTTRKRPFSFEDVIKEFEQSFQEKTAEPVVEPYEVEEIDRTPPPVPVSKPTASTVTSQSPYYSHEGQRYDEQTVDVNTGPQSYERNEKYKIGTVEEHEIVKRLRNPDGLRDAIIFNEIINRKYF